MTLRALLTAAATAGLVGALAVVGGPHAAGGTTATGGGTVHRLAYVPSGAGTALISEARGPAIFSPSGRYMLFGWYHGSYGGGRQWWVVRDLTTGTQKAYELAGSLGGGLAALANDGRTALIHTTASLVPSDANRGPDLYLTDLAGGDPRLLTGDAEGWADGDVNGAAMSPDGAFVAYTSRGRVLLSDIRRGVTTTVSAGEGDIPWYGVGAAAVNADGTVVAFEAVRGPNAEGSEPTAVYVWRKGAGPARKVSRDAGSGWERWHAHGPRLDVAGRTLVYSFGYNRQIIAYDTVAGTDRVVSVTPAGKTATGATFGAPLLSADGRYVAFSANSAALVRGDTYANADIFRRDLKLRQTERINLTYKGAETFLDAQLLGMSPSGLTVVYGTAADGVEPTDAREGGHSVFVRTYPTGYGPPQTSAGARPAAYWNAPNPAMNLVSSQSTSTFDCAVDAEAFKPCPYGFSQHAPLADGRHTLRGRAVSEGGLVDPTSYAYTYTVDTVAPQTRIVSGPGTTTSRHPTFTFASSEPVTYRCKVERSLWRVCGTKWSVRDTLAKGSHVLLVRAWDRANNIDPTPARREFRVR